MAKANVFLTALVALALLAASYEAIAYWHGGEGSERLVGVVGFAYVLLLALWIEEDSKGRPQIYRPFEHGQLAFLLWIPYLPYYLWRTRGARGMVMLCGFVALLLAGWLAQWAIYFAR